MDPKTTREHPNRIGKTPGVRKSTPKTAVFQKTVNVTRPAKKRCRVSPFSDQFWGCGFGPQKSVRTKRSEAGGSCDSLTIGGPSWNPENVHKNNQIDSQGHRYRENPPPKWPFFKIPRSCPNVPKNGAGMGDFGVWVAGCKFWAFGCSDPKNPYGGQTR